MTKLVDQAVAAIRKLPPTRQDELARVMLALASTASPSLEPDEAAAMAEAGIANGQRVQPDVIRAFWKTHGL